MTNFQASERRSPLSRERVLLALPLLVGLGVAGLMLALLVWPAGRQLRRDQLQLEQVQEQQRRLPLLRRQVVTLKQKLDEAMGKRNQILSLIAGSGEISTFMAQLDREAQASGVQLDGYEPITVAAPPPPSQKPPARKSNEPPPPPPDPLLAPGLQKTALLLTARGTGVQLLDFLRRLERLSLLVVPSDLRFELEPPKDKEAPAGITELRLTLTLYSEAPKAPSKSAENAPATKP